MYFIIYTSIYRLYSLFFSLYIETQFNSTVKIFRSDNAQDYNNKSFLLFLDSHGTLSQWSCPYTSQQNGHAERKHRHILDVVRTLLISAFFPKRF